MDGSNRTCLYDTRVSLAAVEPHQLEWYRLDVSSLRSTIVLEDNWLSFVSGPETLFSRRSGIAVTTLRLDQDTQETRPRLRLFWREIGRLRAFYTCIRATNNKIYIIINTELILFFFPHSSTDHTSSYPERRIDILHHRHSFIHIGIFATSSHSFLTFLRFSVFTSSIDHQAL